MFHALVAQVVHLQAIGSVILLVGFLIATTLLQQRALHQSVDVLNSASDPIKSTRLFASAMDYLSRRQIPNLFVSPAHSVPIWFLIIVVLFCSIVSYFGAEFFRDSDTVSYVLGGPLAAAPPNDIKKLEQYQSSTVYVGTMAFLGAYIWTIAQLVMRMNTNDVSPITYYFLSVRILTACVVAGVARHMVEAIPGLREMIYNNADAPVGLSVLGFLIGWNPTLWINQIAIWGSERLKRTIPSQRWPPQNSLPENMTLSMIQGLVDDKIARLLEIDIDNCQKLAQENAVLIWMRTPYSLELVADWVGQAQLCLLFEADEVEALRRVGIRDIFCYMAGVANEPTKAAIQSVLKIPIEILTNHLTAIATDPAFRRLAELRAALLPSSPAP